MLCIHAIYCASGHVFHRQGVPIKNIREAFGAACRKVAIVDFGFHDLRHTAVTNMRSSGGIIPSMPTFEAGSDATAAIYHKFSTINFVCSDASIQVVVTLWCRSGGIGRRTGLKIPRGSSLRVGSSPTSGTREINGSAFIDVLQFTMIPVHYARNYARHLPTDIPEIILDDNVITPE
jgi:hypothetical protein